MEKVQPVKTMAESMAGYEAERDLPEYKRIMKLKKKTPTEEKAARRYEKLVLKPGVSNAIRMEVIMEKEREKDMLYDRYCRMDAENEVRELAGKMEECNKVMEKIETVMKAEPEKEEVMTEERVSKTERAKEIGTKKSAREELTR